MMDKFNFSLPETNLVFGKGVLLELGDRAKEYGSRALLVSGKGSMRRLGFLKKATNLLRSSGIKVSLYDRIEPNPTLKTVQVGIELGIKDKCDLVVALGGGSSIDAAKAIAVGVGHEDTDIWPYIQCNRPTTNKTLPLIAIPSTSGTGSHVTWYTVITNQETHEKAAYSSKYVYPQQSLVDMDIVSKMPPKVTAETGFDALAHSMESHISKTASPITSLLSLRAIKLISTNLPLAYQNGDDTDARYNMALADTYAGICITPSRTIMVHGIGNTVSGVYPEIAHGQALACLTPHVMIFNIENGNKEVITRHCQIAKALGQDVTGIDKKNALKAVDGVIDLQKEIGLFKTLGQCGVSQESIDQLADYSMILGAGALKCNPVKATRKDIIRVYNQSL